LQMMRSIGWLVWLVDEALRRRRSRPRRRSPRPAP
jgi:hypothetical protein